MPAQQKYQKRYTTAVSMEQSEKDLMTALGIEHPQAHRIGLHVIIEQRISDSDPRVTPEIIERFAELKKTLYREFQAYIRLQDAAQMTLQNIKNSVEKTDELIEVWDIDTETYIHIPMSRYQTNPEMWRVRA